MESYTAVKVNNQQIHTTMGAKSEARKTESPQYVGYGSIRIRFTNIQNYTVPPLFKDVSMVKP